MWPDDKLNWLARQKPSGLLLERTPGGKEGPDHVTFMESQMSKVSVVLCLAQKFESNQKSILCRWVPNLGSGMTLLIAPTWKGRECTVTGEKNIIKQPHRDTSGARKRFA